MLNPELRTLNPVLGSLALFAAALMSGCATLPQAGSRAPGASGADLFVAAPIPPDFDAARATLPLDQVPEDPPAPPASPRGDAPELPPAAQRSLDEARRLFAEHRYSETILELGKALRYDANSHEAHRMMAVACLLSGSDARARLSAERAIELRPDSLACHYALGRLTDKVGRSDEARRYYRVALKCQINDSDAGYRALTHYRLGLLLDRQGYVAACIGELAAFEDALQALGDRVEANPELAMVARIHRGPAAILRARSHEALRQFGDAADALGVAAARAPRDFDIRREHVRLLVLAGRADDASAEAARFVDDSDGAQEAVELLLQVHRFAGRPERGVAAMREIIARRPDNVELCLLYCDALLSVSESDEAVRTLQELVERRPASAEARWRLIALYRQLGQWRQWLTALAGAVAAEPRAYARVAGELEELPAEIARRIVDEAGGGKPGPGKLFPEALASAEARSALDDLIGRLCDRLDRVDDGRAAFERAIRRTPQFLPPPAGLAEMHIRRCQWDAAVKVIESARQRGTAFQAVNHGQDARATRRDEPAHQLERLLGECYDGLDDITRAFEQYDKAIELDAADVASMMLRARLYERTGEVDKARRQYRDVLATEQTNIPAREALIRSLLTRPDDREDRGEAVAAEFAELRKLAPRDPATVRCALAIKFMQNRDREAYCGALRQLVELQPEDLRSREELALAFFTLREYADAIVELGEILAREPRSPVGNEFMALAKMKRLAYGEAADHFARMLTWYPNRESWLRGYAELCLIRHDYATAVALWEKLLSLDAAAANRPAYRTRCLEALLLAERFDDAREQAAEWLDEAEERWQGGHDNADERARRRWRWFVLTADSEAGAHERYLERCQAWLALEPNDPQFRAWLLGVRGWAPPGLFTFAAYFDRPRGLIGARRFDEAALRALEWLDHDPNEADPVRWLVEVLQTEGRHDEAVALLEGSESTDADELRLNALPVLIDAYSRAGRYDAAAAAEEEFISSVGKLLQRRPEDSREVIEELIAQERLRLARLFSLAGRFGDAVELSNRMIEEADGPESRAQLLRSLSFIHQRQARNDLALERLREAYDLVPTDVGLNNDLGYTLAEAGLDLEQAERMVRLAVGEAPRVSAYLDSLGWVLYKKGDLEGARAWLTRAATGPQGRDAVIFDHLGDVLWRLGRRDEAAARWRTSIEVYERGLVDGSTDPDEKLVARVNAKLEALEKGDTPDVARPSRP